MSQAKVFILYDARAKSVYGGNTDRATVLDTATSEKEARADTKSMFKGYDAVWYEYDDLGNELKNPKERLDIGKGLLL